MKCNIPDGQLCQWMVGDNEKNVPQPSTDQVSSELSAGLACICGAPVQAVRYRKWDHDGSYQYKAQCQDVCGYPASQMMPTEKAALADYEDYAG
jgi:hypothetical protein